MSFTDKVAIVTGASSGIGAAIAIKFAEEGAKVVVVARNQAKLKEVAGKCEEHGAKTFMIIADVTKNDDVMKIITKTVDQFGKIDVLINNAGMIEKASIWDENAMEVYDKVMATNLRSVVYLTNLAAPHLIKSRGNVVNISSIAAVDVVNPEHFSYCTSKAGMDHFTRSIALDFSSKGVRANCVNPGPVLTDIFQSLGVNKTDIDGFIKILENMTALGRISDPAEIADLVLFVASDKAKAITGSCLVSDNGVLVKRSGF